jgi:hypothetical protein
MLHIITATRDCDETLIKARYDEESRTWNVETELYEGSWSHGFVYCYGGWKTAMNIM